MKTNDSYTNNEVEKIGLIRIFSNLDTQSAIVAALVISLGTILLNYFIKLCYFVYWRAYFDRFYIPLEYFDEAIIQETGTKYILFLFVPPVIFVWWCLGEFTTVINSKVVTKLKIQEKKIRFLDDNKLICKLVKFLLILSVYILFSFLLEIVVGCFWSIFGNYYNIGTILFVEIILYIFIRICKRYFGVNYVFSKRRYYCVRIIGGIISVYLVLGAVFFVGHFSNSGSYIGTQGVRLVNESKDSFRDIKEGDVLEVKMVLLETEDYYYVANCELTKQNGNLELGLWSIDSYRFIDKLNCPILTKYVNFRYYNTRYNENAYELLFGMYFYCVFIFVFIFCCLLSVPANKKD